MKNGEKATSPLYGEEIVQILSAHEWLATGKVPLVRPLPHSAGAEVYSDQKIVYSVRRQLSWLHFRHLLEKRLREAIVRAREQLTT